MSKKNERLFVILEVRKTGFDMRDGGVIGYLPLGANVTEEIMWLKPERVIPASRLEERLSKGDDLPSEPIPEENDDYRLGPEEKAEREWHVWIQIRPKLSDYMGQEDKWDSHVQKWLTLIPRR